MNLTKPFDLQWPYYIQEDWFSESACSDAYYDYEEYNLALFDIRHYPESCAPVNNLGTWAPHEILQLVVRVYSHRNEYHVTQFWKRAKCNGETDYWPGLGQQVLLWVLQNRLPVLNATMVSLNVTNVNKLVGRPVQELLDYYHDLGFINQTVSIGEFLLSGTLTGIVNKQKN